MSQSILYNKSLNPDIPILEIKVFKKKLRIYFAISLVLFLILIGICLVLMLLWFGVINKKSTVVLNRFVKVKCGLLEGKINDGIVEFLGIPYAYPPIERRRFVHAQEILDENGCKQVYGDSLVAYKTNKYKPSCVQYEKTSRNLMGSEDCLYLNVYTPSSNPDKKLPVVFVINGVFFSYGSGNMPGLLILPDVVKATNAIHVTSNYRLGPMSSIINPESNETNHGLSDQVVALKWIHRNIAQFGGDPSNVILYGSGSGSTIALALYNSHKAVHLFSKIWISNPVMTITTTLVDALQSQKVHLINESKLEVFQKQLTLGHIYKNWTRTNIENLLENQWLNFPNPIGKENLSNSNFHFLLVDNDLIRESNLLKKISINRNVPMVIGNNANEVDIFPPNYVRFWNIEYIKIFLYSKMKQFSNQISKDIYETLIKTYAKDKVMKPEDIYTKAVTDIRITCPINSLLKKLMGVSSSQSIYRYILEDQHEYFDYFDMKYSNILAAHGWDSILYFHGYKTHDYGKYGKNETTMSNILNKAMYDFAWYDELKDMSVSKDGYIRMNLIKDGTISRECYFKTNECNFWHDHMGDTEKFMWFV